MTQTRPDRLKTVLTSSNRTQTGPDWLKPVLNGSNQTILAQANQTVPDCIKPDQTGPDRLKPVLTGSNRRRAAQTEFDQLKPDSKRTRPAQIGFDRLEPDKDQTGSNRTQTRPERLKTVLNSSNQTKPAQTDQTGPDWLNPAQTRPDWLKQDLTSSNRTRPVLRPVQTVFEQLKSDQRSTHRV